jgi:hypothetical protein
MSDLPEAIEEDLEDGDAAETTEYAQNNDVRDLK